MTVDLLPSLGRAALYLGVPFVLLIFYLQWKWARTCDRNIRVLVAQKGGGGAWCLAPKTGGEITIKNPQGGADRTWPINELATIDVPYPGVGFIPEFMQKSIRLAIVNEGDWEPMLNRSPHRERIASPDVVKYLTNLAEKLEGKEKEAVLEFVGKLATGPTREMIADPAVLGSLMASGVLKALATVSNDFIDILKSVNAKLGRVVGPSPIVVYIGLGMITILVAFLTYKLIPVISGLEQLSTDVELIKQALGVAGG